MVPLDGKGRDARGKCQSDHDGDEIVSDFPIHLVGAQARKYNTSYKFFHGLNSPDLATS